MDKNIKLEEIENINIETAEENSENEYFICKICLGLVFNPIMCGNCENLYCFQCIDGLMKISKVCPCCRHYFNSTKLGRFANSFLEKIKVKCPFNCGLIINTCKLQTHFLNCDNKPIIYSCKICSKEFCLFKNNYQLIAEHLLECLEKNEIEDENKLLTKDKEKEENNINISSFKENSFLNKNYDIKYTLLLHKLKELVEEFNK